MKIIRLLASMLIASFLFLSCEKENNEPPPPIKTPEEILTANFWKIDMIRFLQNNTAYYYKRGATSGNNENFDNEHVQFKADKTGTYRINNQDYAITWDFDNAAKTSIKFTIQYPQPLVVTWENVVYDDNSIGYGEKYTLPAGTHSLAYATRIPK